MIYVYAFSRGTYANHYIVRCNVALQKSMTKPAWPHHAFCLPSFSSFFPNFVMCQYTGDTTGLLRAIWILHWDLRRTLYMIVESIIWHTQIRERNTSRKNDVIWSFKSSSFPGGIKLGQSHHTYFNCESHVIKRKGVDVTAKEKQPNETNYFQVTTLNSSIKHS